MGIFTRRRNKTDTKSAAAGPLMTRLERAVEKAREEGQQASPATRSRPDLVLKPMGRGSVDSHVMARHNPHSPVMEHVRRAASNLRQVLRQNEWKTVALISARQGEGKSLVAVNLGITLAEQMGVPTALIDADLRRPSVARYLGFHKETAGLSHYLESDDMLAESVVVTDGKPALKLVLGGQKVANPCPLLGQPRMAELMHTLAQECELVLIDTPAILSVADAHVLLPQVDCFLLVVDAKKSKRREVLYTIGLAEREKMAGFIFNRGEEAVEEYYGSYYKYMQYYYAYPHDKSL